MRVLSGDAREIWRGVERRNYKKSQETSGYDGYVVFFDYDNDITGVYRCQNLSNCTI